MTELVPIEPNITDVYLNSSEIFIHQLDDLFSKQSPIYLKTSALENTPYLLKIFRSEDQPGMEKIYIELTDSIDDDTTDPIIDRDHTRTYIPLFIVDGSNLIQADTIHNNSRRTSLPIKGFTAVIAPVEDAICQLFANRTGKTMRRLVNTSHPLESNLAQSYVRRGYSTYGTIGEIGAYLYKDFE